MSPALKGPKRVNVYLPEPLIAALRDMSAVNDMSMSEVVRVALWEYIERTHPDIELQLETWEQWHGLWESRVYSLLEEVQTAALKLAAGELPFDDEEGEDEEGAG